MIMTAAAWIRPEAGSRHRPKGNLCRCTGYRAIRDAIAGAAHAVAAGSDPDPVGRNVAAPAAPLVVPGGPASHSTGRRPMRWHLKVLRSPHAHARIVAIDDAAARAVPGVIAVLTHADAPAGRFSTGRHEDPRDDAADTRVLDPILRFVGSGSRPWSPRPRLLRRPAAGPCA